MAFGFDEGTVVVKIGSEEPVVSMKFYIFLMDLFIKYKFRKSSLFKKYGIFLC